MAYPNRYRLIEHASDLLSNGDFESLTAAALALRMFMETVIYDKANSHKKMLPEEIFEGWQPAKLLRSLGEYDLRADQDFNLSVREESPTGVPVGEFMPVGEHKCFSTRWLSKHYHKLGQVLHYPRTDSEWFLDKDKLQDYLKEISIECNRILEGNILGASFGENFDFDCLKCDAPLVVPAHFADEQKPFPCVRKDCSASFIASRAEDNSINVHRIRQELHCSNEACKEAFMIDRNDVREGAEFNCPKCDTKHLFVLGFIREKL